jgi:hypothetical protein
MRERNLSQFVLISEAWHCVRERIKAPDYLWLHLIHLVGNAIGIVQYHRGRQRGRGQSHRQLEPTSHAEGHSSLELELHLQILEKLVVIHVAKAFLGGLLNALEK